MVEMAETGHVIFTDGSDERFDTIAALQANNAKRTLQLGWPVKIKVRSDDGEDHELSEGIVFPFKRADLPPCVAVPGMSILVFVQILDEPTEACGASYKLVVHGWDTVTHVFQDQREPVSDRMERILSECPTRTKPV